MACEICGNSCAQRVKVFVKGDDKLRMCLACVLRLGTQKLEYNKERQRYRFNGNLRKRGFLSGRSLSEC